MPSLQFDTALDTQQLALLHALGRAAIAHGTKLYAVGGVVRDAILGVSVADIDLTSETPAGELGQALATALGGHAARVTPFATVKLTIDGHVFDLATARAETYALPGTLPNVTPSTIEQDLERRDFTINAIAASLAPADFGTILDLHGGRADLGAGVVRTLHQRSFQDDPTRAFRAVRYATRLGFQIDHRTARWMRRDSSIIQRLTGTRARHELERILDEPRGAGTLADAQRRELLTQIHPAFGANAVAHTLHAATRANLRGVELLAALMYPLSRSEIDPVVSRLSLSKQQATLARSAVSLREAEPRISGAAPSVVDLIVGSLPKATLAMGAAVSRSTPARGALQRYNRRSALIGHHLDGEALISIGVPPGPRLGQALQALRSAELDNIVRSRRGATHFIQRWLQAVVDTGDQR